MVVKHIHWVVSVSWLNNKDIPGLLALVVIISLLDWTRIANNGMSELGDDATCSVRNHVFCCCLGNIFFDTTLTGNICVKMYRVRSSVNVCESLLMCLCLWRHYDNRWSICIGYVGSMWFVFFRQLIPKYIIKYNCDGLFKQYHLQLCRFTEQQHNWDLASVIQRYQSQRCWCSINTTTWLCLYHI